MYLQEDPNSCGIRHLEVNDGDTKAQMVEALQDARDGAGDFGYGDPAGYVLAKTSHHEKEAARALAAAGFRALARFKNPTTKNYVTIWGAPTPKK